MPADPDGFPRSFPSASEAGGSAGPRRIEASSFLETRFPWVMQTIQLMWGYPELETYLHKLTMDERGGRQGFPQEAWEEIHLLIAIHRDAVSGKRW